MPEASGLRYSRPWRRRGPAREGTMTEQHTPATGGCQCGGLRYELSGDPVVVVACHCRDCQRQSGSAFGLTMLVRPEDFRFTTGEPAHFHTRADSGTPKECVFCPSCGVRIYNALGEKKTLNLKPGTLDDTTGVEPIMHVWVDRKQPWLELPPGVKTFDFNPG